MFQWFLKKMSVCFREAKQREEGEEKEKEVTKDEGAADEDEETKAAVVLQSNYRGFKERKKFQERKKTMAGAELQPCIELGQEVTSNQDGRLKTAERQGENEEEEESTYKADEDDDSDHTQVPDDEEPVEMAEEAGEDGLVDMEEETKAATVLQSNFRGHKERKRLQEEGKIPARRAQRPPQVGAEETCGKEEEVDVTAVEIMLGDQEEAKAAVVLQSNFRGHKERKRLEEEGKIPKKKKKQENESELPKEEDSPPGLDEEKAATVLQSNFRGHRDRKKLKEEREMKETARETEEEEEHTVDLVDVVIERRDDADAEKEKLEEEQAAVKIQSNFRGYKDRKNLKANKEAAQTQAEQLENFSKQVCPPRHSPTPTEPL